MILGSFYFKQKARQALKGNWQTALLVTFFAGIFATLASLVQSTFFPDMMLYASEGRYSELLAKMSAVPSTAWIAFYILNISAFIFSPVLALGSNQYFLCRLRGQELGFKGLFSRISSFLRALWLSIVMGVRIFLWSLLLVAPGVIAAIRYSMAPYYLAEDPTLTATQAIEKSKNTMKDLKMSYFSLVISFISWSLMAMIAQMLLLPISPIVALVAAQFMQLAISTYMNASCASFYLTVSHATSLGDVQQNIQHAIRERMQQMGVDVNAMDREEKLEEAVQERDDALDTLNADDPADDGAIDSSTSTDKADPTDETDNGTE